MRTRPSTSELVAWSLVGLGLGLVSGIALAGWLGPIRPRGTRDDREPALAERPPVVLKASAAERAVERTLKRDAELSGFELRALAVGPGVVELHGWVSARSLRTRAMRLAAQVQGIETLVNCLLVHGEDDPARPALDATDQSA
jgi:BON domain